MGRLTKSTTFLLCCFSGSLSLMPTWCAMSDEEKQSVSQKSGIVFLAEGQMWHLSGGSNGLASQQIKSQFASEMKERLLKIHLNSRR